MGIVLQIHSRNQNFNNLYKIVIYKEQLRAFPILYNSEIRLTIKHFFLSKAGFKMVRKLLVTFCKIVDFFNTRDAFAPMSHLPHL